MAVGMFLHSVTEFRLGFSQNCQVSGVLSHVNLKNGVWLP